MERYRHSMDTVFAWLLFAVFAVSSVMLVIMGARIYAGTAKDLNAVDTPVILSYLTEKLRGCSGGDDILEAGDQRLVLAADTQEGEYSLWIYLEDGELKESLVPLGQEPIAGAGTVIAPVKEFRLEESQEGMLQFFVVDQKGQPGSRYYQMGN